MLPSMDLIGSHAFLIGSHAVSIGPHAVLIGSVPRTFTSPVPHAAHPKAVKGLSRGWVARFLRSRREGGRASRVKEQASDLDATPSPVAQAVGQFFDGGESD